ncbi:MULTISPECIES: hypothetical protein [Pseudoalteromonas]|uniref:Uncharacterized protein n=1 Tax=Pseudoalteromonas gelatinilytica TaxID=1703256 RepID=A0ABQ1TZN0_9GAMM|nr:MULTISPECIES: hypothetical protein [Pseudoalteromonas]MCO7251255.1 hypothetical protein [Pseudoalteromonas sp. Ps84H-4]MCP4589044.1 hypothetical protein [Pseudoalteromonas sp.]MDC3188966.1 hypothetical protein [Pseudoalteromonas elyakovii]GGF07224.1 hypothetical protein GCM10008027_35150 [Pseudoalteromonas profundi]|tara:strand:+ start:13672 stop:13905 length:234 start_codon:yes stop_codon:yes gene_type:complete
MGCSKKHQLRKAERAPFNVVSGRTRTVYMVHVKLIDAKRWTELADEKGQYIFNDEKERDEFFERVLATYPNQYRKVA